MLHELTLTNLGVIESASLTMGQGLTVLTGETGAGKTMVLTGLALILGGRSTPDAVRVGASEASAEAIIDLPEGDARDRALEAGALVDEDGTVAVVRIVGTSRSKAVLGGRTVPQALLGELGAELVTVHGQADQARLRTASKQREVLDAFGGEGHAQLMAEYRGAWGAWREASEALARMTESEATERARRERAADDLSVLEAAAVLPGERAAVTAEIEVLAHAETLREAAGVAHDALAGDGEATAAMTLESARRALEVAGHHDQVLAALAVRLADFVYGATDVAQELASYVDRVEADPARLDANQTRLSSIAALERRFACTADELDGIRQRLALEVGQGESWDDAVEAARGAERAARERLDGLADAVTRARSSLAATLAEGIGAELKLLAMPDARIEIALTSREAGPHGADDIGFLLSAHQGAPRRPVAEAASGGELSRIMLAIEVVLAGAGEHGRTFVFDEVDAGVGGRAAQSVGQRLAMLARHHQVIVVTHLAQVAAWADTHVVVEKSSNGAVTVSSVRSVEAEERVREIARLLSGEEDSESARAHALELVEAARVAR